jgi:hypothetical protein
MRLHNRIDQAGGYVNTGLLAGGKVTRHPTRGAKGPEPCRRARGQCQIVYESSQNTAEIRLTLICLRIEFDDREPARRWPALQATP